MCMNMMWRFVMKKIMTRIAAFAAAAVTAVFAAASAAADFTVPFNDANLCFIEGTSSKELTENEAKFTGNVDSTNKFITTSAVLSDELTDAEFWNDPNVTVSCEIMLETEGVDCYAYMPGFDTNYNWIDPSKSITLKTGEWITLSETGTHFYQGFKDNGPFRVLVQVRGTEKEPKEISVIFRNFVISGGAADSAAPEEPSDNNKPDEEKPAQTTAAATTAVQTTAPSIDYGQYNPVKPDASGATAMVFVVIVGAAAVIVVGIIIGYIIYKRKKFY